MDELGQALGQVEGGAVADRVEEDGGFGYGEGLGEEGVAWEVFGGHFEGVDYVGLSLGLGGFGGWTL